MSEEYELDFDLIEMSIRLLEKAKSDFNHDKTDYQKDLVLAMQGIRFLLDEYASKLKLFAEAKERLIQRYDKI